MLLLLITCSVGILHADIPAGDFALSFTRAHRSPVNEPLTFTRHYSFAGGSMQEGQLLPGMQVTENVNGDLYMGNEYYSTYLINPLFNLIESVEPKEWPVGVAFDTKRGIYMIATLSGEGFLYRFNPTNQTLVQVASLQNQDLDSLVYHAADDSLYALNMEGKVLRYSVQGNLLGEISLGFLPFTFNVHNYSSAIVSVGENLAVLMEPQYGTSNDLPKESRIYKVNPARKTAEQTYRKVWQRWPLNTLPAVQIVHPAPTNFTAGTTIKLVAKASDYENRVQFVQFSINGQILNARQEENDTTMFAVEHIFNLPGIFEIIAKAIDFDGGTNVSQAVAITIPPSHSVDLRLPFTHVHRENIDAPLVFWKEYSLTSGPIGGGKLLPGMLLDGPDSESFFGTENHSVYHLEPTAGTIEIISPNHPDFSWPMGVAYDDERGEVKVASLGGEGHFYGYNPTTKTLRTISSMQNRDVDSLGYNDFTRLFYAMETKNGGNEGRILVINGEGQVIQTLIVPDLPNSIGPGGDRSEIVQHGAMMVLMIEPRGAPNAAPNGESSIYLIDLQQNTVQLTYRRPLSDEEPSHSPPMVQMLTPTIGVTIQPGTSVFLQARAIDSDGQVQAVQFRNNGNPLGMAALVERLGEMVWQFKWTPMDVGAFEITALAIDNDGLSNISSPVRGKIAMRQPPVVTILQPSTDGMIITNSNGILLVAQTQSGFAPVTEVEFYSNGKFLGRGSKQPLFLPIVAEAFAFTWTNVFFGTNIITAKAMDASGQKAESNPRFVIIRPDAVIPPVVFITHPSTGSQHTVGETLVVRASARDPDGYVAKVEFFNNLAPFGVGVIMNPGGGSNQVFTLQKRLDQPGIYRLTAKATDNRGNIASSTNLVHVVVSPASNNIPPTVQMVGPANGSIFNEEARIRLVATATDLDGFISKVEFYLNQAFFGEGIVVTNSGRASIAELNWKVVTPGTYTVQAKATDNRGTSTFSLPIAIKVTESGEPYINFSLDFVAFLQGFPKATTVFTHNYNEDGELSGNRLLPGFRLVKLGTDYYGLDNGQFFKVDGITGHVTLISALGSPVPELSHPMGIAADTMRNRLLIATLGGEGYLYSYVPENNSWSVVSSLNNLDFDSLVYHPSNNRLYATAVTGAGETGKVYEMDAEGVVRHEISLSSIEKGIGFNGLRSELVAINKDFVAVLLESNHPGGGFPEGSESHIFVIDLRNNIAREVYSKTWFGEPVGISILSPQHGQHVILGERLNLIARVDSVLTPIQISFKANGAVVAPGLRGTSNLWTNVWTPPQQGIYEITVTSRDGRGFTNHSTPVTITVHPRVTNQPPQISIIQPTDGSKFFHGESIEILIQTDRTGYFSSVEVYDGFTKIGNATPQVVWFALDATPELPVLNPIMPPYPRQNWRFVWENASPGNHQLIARSFFGALEVQSSPVNITVTGSSNSFAVNRLLPLNYAPNVPLQVMLTVSGAANAGAYAIEDQPPIGWTVSEISHGGEFDPFTGKVKYGPFTDQNNRILVYTVTPPASTGGVAQFMGRTSVQGRDYPIIGSNTISPFPRRHPADINPPDDRIDINELTAYATAWRDGALWNGSREEIPLPYVTRAGLIWKRGEAYRIVPGMPPGCWVPAEGIIPIPIRPKVASAAQSKANRVLQSKAGEIVVTVSVTPAPQTSAYALEERLPAGWRVVENDVNSSIHGGTLRWGPFYDDLPRTLRYTVAPQSFASTDRIEGIVSFDGSNETINGQHNASNRPSIQNIQRNGEGLRLKWNESSNTRVIIEATDDLASGIWQPLGTVEAGLSEAILPQGTELQRFYRLRAE
ncbi:MAG: Ig-like domain-containing protein [Verrucomicrobiales bacterium]